MWIESDFLYCTMLAVMVFFVLAVLALTVFLAAPVLVPSMQELIAEAWKWWSG